MSAVPVPALAFGGTSALPSSVAFILSAKAGPANATAAANASVASMVLFDIGFLPVDAKRRCQLQNSALPDLFPNWRSTHEISWKPIAESAAILAIGLKLGFSCLTRFLHANRYPLRLKTLY